MTNWSNKSMLLLNLCIFSLCPIYGIFGFFAPFGLVSQWEIFIFGFIFGLVVGSTQSYSRSLYAQLIPIGRETEFFSLYQITDRGSSWIGPAVLGIISNYTTIRWGLLYAILLLAIPLPIIYRYVDVEKGREQAGKNKE